MLRKLTLAVAVVAAMAVTASPARADPVEVEDRASSEMCDDTTLRHCEWHIINDDADLIVHTFLGEFSYNCDWEIHVRISSRGVWVSVRVRIADGTSTNCDEDLRPCEEPWVGLLTHNGAGTESMKVAMCIDPPIIGTCEGDMHVDLDKNGDDYSFELSDVELEGDPNCEFTGDFTAEDPDGIEIHHT